MDEISLENVGSATENLVNVDIKNDEDSITDLDLLMDPNKSRGNSPVSHTEKVEPVIINNDKKFESNNVSKKDFFFKPVKPVVKKNIIKNLDSNINDKFISEEFNVDDLNITAEKKSSFNEDISNNSSFSNVNSFTNKNVDTDSLEKQELLFKLKRFEMRGIPLSRKYSLNSDINDMREEFLRIKAQRDIENSIRFQRKTMMAFVSGAEFLNSKFDPLDVKLDGWSESIHESLGDYDEVFEELHEKYKTKAKVAPELKLLMMLGGSAVMFHMTNTLFKNSMPGMDEILKQNPDLAKQFAQAAVNSTNVGQDVPEFGNLVGEMVGETTNMRGDNSRQANVSTMNGPSDDDVNRILYQINDDGVDGFKDINKSINIRDDESIVSSVVSSDNKKKRGRRSKRSQLPSFDLDM